ncbi:MAG: LacI family transcriptional regulator [Chloroflexi bacterium]|nr:LacI family transcriptional regulator [Chloroflexota bacterium]
MTRTRRQTTKRVTIKDIAQAAGVSVTTVSNVLNHRFDAMTEQTLERVVTAMNELGYRPNLMARGLVTRRTATIGVIIAEIETPLFLQALSFMEPIAREAGYNLLISKARTEEDEQQAIKVLTAKQVDGLIFLSVSQYTEDEHLNELRQLDIPTVLVNRATLHNDFDHINWDDVDGMEQATEHLIRLGHRHIAHLRGPLSRQGGANRLEGYRRALERHGLSYREEYVRPGDYTLTPEQWQRSTLELLELSPRPTALIASDDIVAAVAMKAIHEAGLHAPDDMAIIGFDDQYFCQYLHPALTTVRIPFLEAGQRAVELVLERIATQRTEAKHIRLPCSLIVRESCGATLVNKEVN